VRHAQVCAHQVWLNKSNDPDEKENDTKKFADGFSHNSLLTLLFEKRVHNRERSHRLSKKGRFRENFSKVRAKAGMGGLYTIDALSGQRFSPGQFVWASATTLSLNFRECYTL
jgi:hypothetical protein